MDKVVMRDDLTWSDGKPITAHDVEFTFKVIMTEAVPIPAVRTGTDQLKWVEAYDDHTLVFFHKEPLATNDGNMKFSDHSQAHLREVDRRRSDDGAQRASHAAGGSSGGRRPVRAGAPRPQPGVRVSSAAKATTCTTASRFATSRTSKTVRVKVIEDRNTALLALKGGPDRRS